MPRKKYVVLFITSFKVYKKMDSCESVHFVMCVEVNIPWPRQIQSFCNVVWLNISHK